MTDYNRTYRFREFAIPEYMMGGIQRWIENGIEPGNFLSAVIKNDLKEAVMRADDNNIQNLPAYVSFFYSYAPAQCWGSVERFKTWHDGGWKK